jgi:hypothetical protein
MISLMIVLTGQDFAKPSRKRAFAAFFPLA